MAHVVRDNGVWYCNDIYTSGRPLPWEPASDSLCPQSRERVVVVLYNTYINGSYLVKTVSAC